MEYDGGVSNDVGSSNYLAELGLVAGRFYLFPGVWGLHKGHDVLTEAIEAAPAAKGIPGRPKKGSKYKKSLLTHNHVECKNPEDQIIGKRAKH